MLKFAHACTWMSFFDTQKDLKMQILILESVATSLTTKFHKAEPRGPDVAGFGAP